MRESLKMVKSMVKVKFTGKKGTLIKDNL